MNKLTSTLKLSAAGLLLVALTGCTSFLSVGSPEYACSGLPEGAACQSTRDIYESTHDGNVPLKLLNEEEQASAKTKKKSRSKSKQRSTDAEKVEVVTEVARDPVIDNYVAPRLPDRPIPIRTPAQVMRIWIAPWEDTNGDLVTNGYVYTEIEPRRWVIGQQGAAEPTVLKPLQTLGSKQRQKTSNE